MSAEQGRHPCVIRIKGVPLKATVEDVLAFFKGHDIDETSVRLRFKDKRGAGEAIVVFKSAEEAKIACEKDGDFFSPKYGSRFVRVSLAEDLSLEEEAHISKNSPPKGPSTITNTANPSVDLAPDETAIKIEGLPANITIPELVQLFFGTRATAASTIIQHEPEKEHAHAYVDLGAAEHAMNAAVSWNGTVFTNSSGMFTLKVQPATQAEYNTAAAVGSIKSATGDNDAVIKLRGLPVRATAADVAAFFEGYKVKVNGLHVQPFSENRHSKIAYVEFETAEEAERAMEKDRQLFGKAFGERYCLLQRVTYQEMSTDLSRFAIKSTSRGGGSHGHDGGGHGTVVGPHSTTSSLDFTTMAPSGAFFSIPRASSMPPAGAFMIPPGMYPSQGQPMMVPQLAPGMAAMPMTWPGAAAAPMQMFPPAMAYPGFFPGLTSGYAPFGPPSWPPGPPAAAAPVAAALQAPQAGQPVNQQQGAARYLVQDLNTGQKVYLDPRFNVYAGAGMHPSSTTTGSGGGGGLSAGAGHNGAINNITTSNGGDGEGIVPDTDGSEQKPQRRNPNAWSTAAVGALQKSSNSKGSEPTEETAFRSNDSGSDRGSAEGKNSPQQASMMLERKKVNGSTSREHPLHKRTSFEVEDLPEDSRPVKHKAAGCTSPNN